MMDLNEVTPEHVAQIRNMYLWDQGFVGVLDQDPLLHAGRLPHA